jgi:hypothetical protein
MAIFFLELLQGCGNFCLACFLLCNSVIFFASFKFWCELSVKAIVALLSFALIDPLFVMCMSFFVTFLHLFWIIDSITRFKMCIEPNTGFIPAIWWLWETLFEILLERFFDLCKANFSLFGIINLFTSFGLFFVNCMCVFNAALFIHCVEFLVRMFVALLFVR